MNLILIAIKETYFPKLFAQTNSSLSIPIVECIKLLQNIRLYSYISANLISFSLCCLSVLSFAIQIVINSFLLHLWLRNICKKLYKIFLSFTSINIFLYINCPNMKCGRSWGPADSRIAQVYESQVYVCPDSKRSVAELSPLSPYLSITCAYDIESGVWVRKSRMQ